MLQRIDSRLCGGNFHGMAKGTILKRNCQFEVQYRVRRHHLRDGSGIKHTRNLQIDQYSGQ